MTEIRMGVSELQSSEHAHSSYYGERAWLLGGETIQRVLGSPPPPVAAL